MCDCLCCSSAVAQTRDAILKGAHPISVEYAVQFAGMQCQIQFNDHVETKHKPGFIEYAPVLVIVIMLTGFVQLLESRGI